MEVQDVRPQPENPEIHEEPKEQTSKVPHDSMVTVRLSEPPEGVKEHRPEEFKVQEEEIREEGAEEEMATDMLHNRSSQVSRPLSVRTSNLSAVTAEEISPLSPDVEDIQLRKRTPQSMPARRGSDSSDGEDGQVNWAELEKTEEQQPRDQDSEDVSSYTLSILLG